MKRIWITAAVICTMLAATACKEKVETKVLTKEVSFTKEGDLRLLKAENDSVVAQLDIEIADDAYQTETGLMYRKSMPSHMAMLFIFEDERPRSFYMKNTEFALDIIYLNSKKEVVSIQKNAQPFDERSLPSAGPVQYVLEVNANLTDQWGLAPGDKIEWSRITN
jgi:uncharacterized membrane protein (UPF0127 family)